MEMQREVWRELVGGVEGVLPKWTRLTSTSADATNQYCNDESESVGRPGRLKCGRIQKVKIVCETNKNMLSF